MSDFLEKVTSDQDPFKRLMEAIPGFGGYVKRQNRRAADKLLRETVARRFQEHVKRASNLQAEMVSAGRIGLVDDMEKATRQLQTFVDKISTASYGATGLFDAVKINEEELAQLYQFDAAFFDLGDQVARGLDTVEATLQDEAGLPAAIRNVVTLARQAVDTFDRRREVITGSK